MSNSPAPLDPKEATEAKLCAYLEGELQPAERAEIEQHLAANPQHRNLLADLAQTREWMRAIPRETAPSELAESFQGQVERTMLLDGAESDSAAPIRWPQFAMIAAIVVLMLSLGVTLVVMLKGSGSNHSFSIAPNAGAPPSTLPTDAKAPAEKSAPMAVSAVPPVPATSPVPGGVALVPTPDAIAADRAVPNAMMPALAGPHAGDLGIDALKTKLAFAGYRASTDVKSVCFMVRTDAPAMTADQVRGFFIRHQLVLEEPANLLPGNAENAIAKADQGQGRPMVPAAAGAPAPPGAMNNSNNAADRRAAPSQNQAGQNQAQDQIAQNQKGQTLARQRAEPQAIAGQDAAATGNGLAMKNVGGGGGGGQQAPASQIAAGNASQLPSAAAPNVLGDLLYVAHGLSPLQLELLGASLAADNPNQSITRLTLFEGTAKELPPPAGAIVKGQTLTITVAQLVGPGIDKTNIVKVADDGTVALPMIDPLPAAGATPAELQPRIATKYREANLIPDATVIVVIPPVTQPATLPATRAIAKVADAAQPTSRQAATQPAHDDGIDVVVVIEKSDVTDKAK